MSNISLGGGAVDGVIYNTNVVPYTGTTAAVDNSAVNLVEYTGVNGALTINATNVADGQLLTVVVVTAGTTSNTVTFGTGFKSTGTLATGTVAAKTFVVSFVAVGTTLLEVSRTAAQ